MVFETKRLDVRRLTPIDLQPFGRLQSDPDVRLYTGSRILNNADCISDLKHIIQSYLQPENGFWIWAVVHKKNEQLIGTCALVRRTDGSMELGYRLKKEFWRKGFGSEVFDGLILHAFNTLGLNEIFAEVDERNTASLKIIEKRMHFVSAYFNTDLNCLDRLYVLKRIVSGQKL